MLEVKKALKVGKYVLENPDKVERALHGSPNDKGEFVGGVLKADNKYDNDALLAEYDRIGGLITLKGDKVRTGSFFNFTAKKPHEEAQVQLEFRVNGERTFVDAKDESPKTQAVKEVAKKTTARKKAAASKSK